MARTLAVLHLTLLTLVVFSGTAVAATRCAGDLSERFRCTALTVPLDREGIRQGTLRLPVALEKPREGARGFVLALSGGPGQSTISAATFLAETHAPLLAGSRLVVFDQRGTGAEALSCPSLQRLGATEEVSEGVVRACAERLGPARADYTTSDSVEDIEALRRQLGARQLTITGVSYGTYVAVQYARRYPDRVRRLVLDSPVGPAGIDSFQLDSLAFLPRILGEWCRGRPCPASVGDPWANLRSTATRLSAGGLKARIPDASGQIRSRTMAGQAAVLRTLIASDLNPALQALLPAALAAGAAGNAGPLLRLQRAAGGPPLRTRDLSVALNLATVCSDVALPYGLGDGPAEREGAIDAALASVSADRYAPFTAAVVRSESIGRFCLEWPAAGGQAEAEKGPFPAVPALILSGAFDQRTPVENARALAAEIPGAKLLVVPGTGHDTIDSDLTGCVNRALSRFARDVPVGSPCRGRDNRITAAGIAPDSIAAGRRPSGSYDRRDTATLGAIVVTLQDARLHALAQLYAGFTDVSGGGGRAGAFRGRNGLELRGYETVAGAKLDGRDVSGAKLTARLPGGRRVVIRVGAERLTGRVQGRRFSVRVPSLPSPLE